MKPALCSKWRRLISSLVCLSGTFVFAWNSVHGADLIRAGRGIRAHDPSTAIKCNDRYWIFYTGVGIPSLSSTNLLDWEAGPRIFSNSPPWVAEAVPENRRTHFWAPDVIRAGSRYLVYYSVSSFGKNTSAIGLASNPTLDPRDSAYRWTDEGIVVRSRASDAFNAIDPAVIRDAQGRLWLAFGSFWSGLKLIELDRNTGKRLDPEQPMVALAYHNAIEAAAIHQRGNYFYLFYNWGTCCRGTTSTYNIRVARSPQITGPYIDKDGRNAMEDGGSLLLGTQGQMIGPGHAAVLSEGGKEWFTFHFYDGRNHGIPNLAIATLKWTTNDWPELEAADARAPGGRENSGP